LRKFGCEFEFSTPLDSVIKKLKDFFPKNKADSTNRWHKSINNKKWHIKFDGSTESEITTPVSTLNDLNDICNFLDYTKTKKFRVTKKDGLHIHIQATGVSVRRLVAAWLLVEVLFFDLVPRYRRTREHCSPVWLEIKHEYSNNSKKIEEVIDDALLVCNNHHVAFSTERFDGKTHTVEIRIAEGSNDSKFVKAWILLCLAFVEWSKRKKYKELVEFSRLSFNKMVEELQLQPDTISILRKRYKKFRKKT
jgi:hypothetical protein